MSGLNPDGLGVNRTYGNVESDSVNTGRISSNSQPRTKWTQRKLFSASWTPNLSSAEKDSTNSPIIPTGGTGSLDEEQAVQGDILSWRDPLTVVYIGVDATPNRHLLHATSDDGTLKNLTKQGELLIGEPSGVAHPRYIVAGDTHYVFYNINPSGTVKIAYASGPDLNNLTHQGLILSPTDSERYDNFLLGDVFVVGNKLHFFIEGSASDINAEGVHYTANAVGRGALELQEIDFTNKGIGTRHELDAVSAWRTKVTDGVIHSVYEGSGGREDGDNKWALFSATAPVDDISQWTRTGNDPWLTPSQSGFDSEKLLHPDYHIQRSYVEGIYTGGDGANRQIGRWTAELQPKNAIGDFPDPYYLDSFQESDSLVPRYDGDRSLYNIVDSPVYEGRSSLEGQSPTGGGTARIGAKDVATGTSPGTSFGTLVRLSDTNNNAILSYGVQDGGNYYDAEIRSEAGEIVIVEVVDGTRTDLSTESFAPSAGKWYLLTIDWDDTTTPRTHNLMVRETDGFTTEAQTSTSNDTFGAGGYGFAVFNGSSQSSVYFDQTRNMGPYPL